jgi:WD40 repeat protein
VRIARLRVVVEYVADHHDVCEGQSAGATTRDRQWRQRRRNADMDTSLPSLSPPVTGTTSTSVTRRLVRTLKGQITPADHVRFSSDGRLLAAAGGDGAIRIWKVTGDDDPVVLTGAVGQTAAISFSPDGELIAGVSSDDIVRLWNIDGTGEPLTFDHHADARQLAFSADGRQLITLYGKHIRVAPCEICGPIGEVLALAEQRAIRDFTPEERTKYLRELE